MSTQESRDQIARASVVEVMSNRRHDRKYTWIPADPKDVLAAGIESAGDSCARHLASGRLGLAHAFARVHAELLASQRRMHARWTAQREAEAVSR